MHCNILHRKLKAISTQIRTIVTVRTSLMVFSRLVYLHILKTNVSTIFGGFLLHMFSTSSSIIQIKLQELFVKFTIMSET